MNYVAARILIVFFGAVVIASCSENPFTSPLMLTDEATLPDSPKEILVSDSRFDKPYTILGPVETTQKKKSSIFVGQIELRNKAVALLKQAALVKYGDKVDAIIDTQVVESTVKNDDIPLSVTYVRGIAIAFIPEARTSAKNKTKSKVKTSKSAIRSTPFKGGANKNPAQEIQITPSELLK